MSNSKSNLHRPKARLKRPDAAGSPQSLPESCLSNRPAGNEDEERQSAAATWFSSPVPVNDVAERMIDEGEERLEDSDSGAFATQPSPVDGFIACGLVAESAARFSRWRWPTVSFRLRSVRSVPPSATVGRLGPSRTERRLSNRSIRTGEECSAIGDPDASPAREAGA
jgi:hypothetical protein